LQVWIGGLTVANAQSLGGRSIVELTDDILQGRAHDSSHLDGKTFAEVVQQAATAVGSQISGVMVVPALYEHWNEATSEMAPIGQHWVEIGHVPYGERAVSLLVSGGLAAGGSKQHT